MNSCYGMNQTVYITILYKYHYIRIHVCEKYACVHYMEVEVSVGRFYLYKTQKYIERGYNKVSIKPGDEGLSNLVLLH